MHGINNVFNGGHCLRHWIWGVLTVLGVVYWIYLTMTIVAEFVEYHKTVEVSTERPVSLRTPNITICASDPSVSLPPLDLTFVHCQFASTIFRRGVLSDRVGCLQVFRDIEYSRVFGLGYILLDYSWLRTHGRVL